MKILKLGTFNVRGLTKQFKQNQLAADLKNYDVDICGMQETKISEKIDKDIGNYRMILLSSESEHYGNGFMIKKELSQNIYSYWKVSDRIGVLQFTTNEDYKTFETEVYDNNMKMKIRLKTIYKAVAKGLKTTFKKIKPKQLISIVNVYAPHTQRVKDDPKELDDFYDDLNKILQSLSKTTTFIVGDWNAKVGRKKEDDTCLGRYSRGRRNLSGQQLVEFCEAYDLKIANSCFQHPARHQTTWSQTKIMKDTNRIITLYNMIDYILIPHSQQGNLVDARSYNNLETSSDHRLVICKIKVADYLRYKKMKKKLGERYDTQKLIQNKETKERYAKMIEEQLTKRQDNDWGETKEIIHNAAKKHIGYVENAFSKMEFSEKIEQLSKKQKDIRIQIENSNNLSKIIKLRKKRNKILKEIQDKQKEVRNRNADNIIEQIDKVQNDRKMYSAIKILNMKERENNFVFDGKGKCVTNPNEINQLVTEHFKQNLFDPTIPEIEQFKGQPRPLNNPITDKEVKDSITKFSNNKAPGEDQIQVELIKYGPTSLIIEIQKTLNNIFTEHQDNVNLNKSILIPAQKPNKTKGPIQHLRAINLLNTIRKILSSITLKRINSKINSYLSASQAAYRTGRSTTDIVWAHKFIIAKVQKYQELEVYITGIDMSAAFDTIHRHSVIKELENILEEDELRMTQLLLSNTSIKIKTGEMTSEEVKTNIGSPQGDALSGTMFNVMFEASLRKVRTQVNSIQPTIEHAYVKKSNIPDEMIYADDCDFETEDPEKKRLINRIVAETLKTDNLKVNDSKTEHTTIKREKKRIDEKWRAVKKLGSLLGDSEDVIRRKQLSYSAMNKIKPMWNGRKKVKIDRRIKAYNALVKSVLLYNSCTWGLTKTETDKLDAHHRKQLRQLWNRNKMKNKELYKLSNVKPVSHEIKEARWCMFGHALRLAKETPAQKAMEYYFTPKYNYKKFKGKTRASLPVVLDRDIKELHKSYPNSIEMTKFESIEDLQLARTLAKDREIWKKIVKMICKIT